MDDGQPIVGDMFVSALGSPGQLPPDIGALALEARRSIRGSRSPDEERPVWIKADFARADGRYLGYTVHIRIGDGYRAFEVRGAASRFVPREELRGWGPLETRPGGIAARGARTLTKGGNFAGGMGPTAVQGSQQHVKKEEQK